MNVITAAVPYIIAIGCMFLPADFTAMLPSAVQSIVTQPMLVGIILLIILNLLNNTLLRPLLRSLNNNEVIKKLLHKYRK